jgi:hypothetical protein
MIRVCCCLKAPAHHDERCTRGEARTHAKTINNQKSRKRQRLYSGASESAKSGTSPGTLTIVQFVPFLSTHTSRTSHHHHGHLQHNTAALLGCTPHTFCDDLVPGKPPTFPSLSQRWTDSLEPWEGRHLDSLLPGQWAGRLR